MPTPEEYAAERQERRAAKYRAEVARLRALAVAPTPTTDPPAVTEGDPA